MRTAARFRSPKKVAPQDLFTTPGYHASPSTRCFRHVRRRSSRECRTVRHTACRVSAPMCKSWFVGRGSRASTTPTPEPPATDVDNCGDTHGSDLSRQIDRRGSPCIFRSAQHLAGAAAVVGRDSYAGTTLAPDSWRGRHVDVCDKHPEVGQGRPSTTRAHAWPPQRAPHVNLPSTSHFGPSTHI